MAGETIYLAHVSVTQLKSCTFELEDFSQIFSLAIFSSAECITLNSSVEVLIFYRLHISPKLYS